MILRFQVSAAAADSTLTVRGPRLAGAFLTATAFLEAAALAGAALVARTGVAFVAEVLEVRVEVVAVFRAGALAAGAGAVALTSFRGRPGPRLTTGAASVLWPLLVSG